jgi:predicted aspartyl protease
MPKIFTCASAVALLMAGSAVTFAEQPGSDWMTREQVMKKLEAAGYTSITELEADDGHWEGEGVKNGMAMEFHVDPHSGALTKEEPEDD